MALVIEFQKEFLFWVLEPEPEHGLGLGGRVHNASLNTTITTRLYGLVKSYPPIACRRALKSLQGH